MFALTITGRAEQVGGFAVARVLPWRRRRSVGPFVFLDHMGPAQLEPGRGADVGPHPHIGLATVTYLFEGEVVHRDSVGSIQAIRPGDVNWMTAGRGITHSERSDARTRADGGRLHGLQAWVAVPMAHEDDAPSFAHHPAATLPTRASPGVHVRLIAGHAFGLTSPVAVLSPLFYAELRLEAGARCALPVEHPERAVYVVDGAVEGLERGQLGVLDDGATGSLVAGPAGAHVMCLGGAPLDAPRHIWWNFVASTPERIDRAAMEWRQGRFAPVVDDDGPPIAAPSR